jgi:hypothetical protein
MFSAGCTMNIGSKKLLREVASTFCGAQVFFSVSELIERLTRRPVRHSISLPWVSTKGIAGSRMRGLQRTRASALYTRLSVLPRFLFSLEFTFAPSRSAESKRFAVPFRNRPHQDR